MSKDKRIAQFEPESGSRSAEREALATAIAVRDAAKAEEATLKRGAERAKADAFLARRTVEAAEAALSRAQETARFALADAYLNDEATDGSDIAEAEAALATAQRRAAELALIAQELGERSSPAPGQSVPNIRVAESVRAVVKAAPIVRRLVADFDTARRTFQTYHSTLRWLAAHNCIPADLLAEAPKAHETFYAEPAVEWVQALEALKLDADATLPE